MSDRPRMFYKKATRDWRREILRERKPLCICFASVCFPDSSLSTTAIVILESNNSLQLDQQIRQRKLFDAHHGAAWSSSGKELFLNLDHHVEILHKWTVAPLVSQKAHQLHDTVDGAAGVFYYCLHICEGSPDLFSQSALNYFAGRWIPSDLTGQIQHVSHFYPFCIADGVTERLALRRDNVFEFLVGHFSLSLLEALES